MASKDNLIVALDFPTLEDALHCVETCGEVVTFYKVGMELFYATNAAILTELKKRQKKIFLDLKLFDIPNTVSHALRVLTRLGVDMINVHALGGREMMSQARKAVEDEARINGITPPKLIAVTILTSIDDAQFKDLNIVKSIPEEVVSLAKLAKESGLDGVVASPKESQLIANACGDDFLIVTPGVRPAGSDLTDQKRVMTPAEAFKQGSTHIVVGRPITKNSNPKEAAEAILKEIEGS